MDKGRGGAADAGMIVSTDVAEYECKGSANVASYGFDSAEHNDNDLDKEMTILFPTYVKTTDYNYICARKWGGEHYIRYFPSFKRPSTNCVR